MVPGTSPVATGLALRPHSLMIRSTVLWEDAPVVEYAMRCPSPSRIDCSGDLAATHQNVSLDPVELATTMRSGAPFPYAPRLPSTPALRPISTEPDTTTCSVSPPPWV